MVKTLNHAFSIAARLADTFVYSEMHRESVPCAMQGGVGVGVLVMVLVLWWCKVWVWGQFVTTVDRVWWIVWVTKGLPVLATMMSEDARKWRRAMVSPPDNVMSESWVNWPVGLGRQDMRRVRSV